MSTQNSLPRTPASKGAKANLGARQNYVLRSTDLIQVEVFQEEDLYKEVRVAADGMIVLPLIGKVKVAGMTVSEAQEKIRELYDQKYLVDPQINLLVIQYAPRRVQVLGQVNQPGYVIIPPEEEMTLAQAISGAHGMTLRADPKNVKIKRVADGKTKVFTINFNEILRNPEAKDVYVHDGDTIYVEERLF
tara:strand:+ start:5193 stop:5762 length:570 start_codon:yes stop_codon:yes gene_type:complete